MNTLNELKQAVIQCRTDDVLSLTKQALEQNTEPGRIIQEGLVAGIQDVGEKFAQGIYFLPELLVAGQGVQEAVDMVEPHIPPNAAKRTGSFLIGTVRGDIHDIGKNIVSMILKVNGWEVDDAGVDVEAQAFCAMAAEKHYDVIGLSGLLTMTMGAMEEAVKALKESGLDPAPKIMIGGAPLTQEFCNKIGADAIGFDAWDAVTKAQALMQGQ
ncbi:dimethylamine corrinoid protein [Desulfatibacillum alkenivorans DSM 16219]|jgi:5-methyltetrahydrofolate--homocysteine methyltransferase|uniref:Dimethylamine corrinoid protein n=1 Tax=Desulfatibacillum alkenivorans DSM 16219 TaxID=1121393 RepID=A0A1M6L1Y3_9BACT|nr:cobalamin-dependent protein [Desulfatibacillum alkenivorans]SHJ65207.1 dimethylamine corrinoid protein [Desulfatibacillum alkenivorans DSM 16219]